MMRWVVPENERATKSTASSGREASSGQVICTRVAPVPGASFDFFSSPQAQGRACRAPLECPKPCPTSILCTLGGMKHGAFVSLLALGTIAACGASPTSSPSGAGAGEAAIEDTERDSGVQRSDKLSPEATVPDKEAPREKAQPEKDARSDDTVADEAAHAGGKEHEHHGHAHEGAQAPIGHRFKRAKDWVKRFEGRDRDRWQKPREVIAKLAIEPGMTVADLGAGTGYFLSHLTGAVGPSGKVLALDIEPDMVRHMRRRARRKGWKQVVLRRVQVDDPGLDPGSVDRVLVVDTWHHIPQRSRYIRKLARALRPGGTIAVVDFEPESKRGPKHHKLSSSQVIAELEAAGLSAQAIAESLPEQYMVVARAR